MARFGDYSEALARVKPDVVSVNTWPDTHADFAVRAFQAGAHVFLEKPIAETVADAERVVAAAKANNRKLLVGLRASAPGAPSKCDASPARRHVQTLTLEHDPSRKWR